MANVLQIPHIFAQHQTNMMSSLAHRLEVARATNNLQLVELLERERQQIVANAPALRSRRNWLKNLQKAFSKVLWGNAELQVHQYLNGSDRWWYAFDPQTGNCVYADSEAEMRLWIKHNYQGK